MKHSWQYMKLNEVCDKGSSNVVINKLSETMVIIHCSELLVL